MIAISPTSKALCSTFLITWLSACSSDSTPVTASDSSGTGDGAAESDSQSDGSTQRPLSECAIDIHQHLSSAEPFERSAEVLIGVMDDRGISRALLMPPPESSEQPPGSAEYAYNDDDHPNLQDVVMANSDRFSLVAGGGILMPWIHEASEDGRVISEGEKSNFRGVAGEIADDVVAFGEFAVLHLSYQASHPFISIQADHPLFLELADVAAQEGIPIDVHVELTAAERDVRTDLVCFIPESQGGGNPDVLDENLTGFETFLTRNRTTAENLGSPENARVVWTHVGWDNIGDMTTDRLRTMLNAHTNLYLALKLLNDASECQVIDNRPLRADGTIWPAWKELIEEFPDRFVLGADEFFGADSERTAGSPSTEGTWSLLDQLEEDVARQIACTNPARLYNLD